MSDTPAYDGQVIRVREEPGAFAVVAGGTDQSFVDLARPDRLEFEYVARICEALDETVLAAASDRRVRVVHVGGGGLTIPRWVEHRRPHTAQIVLEPDAALVAQVRRLIPLPARSGIKIREVDGRAGIAAMPADYADAVVVDAFFNASMPGELCTLEYLDAVKAVLRKGGVVTVNITDRAPFTWARRFVAGVAATWTSVLVSSEPAIWKGRRFGNLVVVASDAALPVSDLESLANRAVFPHRVVAGRELTRWVGGSAPWRDGEESGSPGPPGGKTWFT